MKILSPLPAWRRRLLRWQGFAPPANNAGAIVAAMLRVAPALTAVGATIAAFTASSALFALLAVCATLGATTGRHPFDLVAIGIARVAFRWQGRLPAYPVPRRSACVCGAIWLTAAACSCAFGLPAVGSGLGAALALVATVGATTDFCAPCLLFCRLSGHPSCHS